MTGTLDHMSKAKKPTAANTPTKPSTSERHKPRRMVGVPERVCVALKKMGDAREADLTEMVKLACIFFLEKHGAWEPLPQPKP